MQCLKKGDISAISVSVSVIKYRDISVRYLVMWQSKILAPLGKVALSTRTQELVFRAPKKATLSDQWFSSARFNTAEGG
jgi:hypothetical protein